MKYRRLLRQQLRRGEREPANAQELLEVMTPADISGLDVARYREWVPTIICIKPPTREEMVEVFERAYESMTGKPRTPRT